MTYRFLRFRSCVRMAEGAKVEAESEAGARLKAEKMFYESGDEYQSWWPEVFVLRTETNCRALALHEIEEKD